ncbi:MAG: hypothetical protein LQ340_003202 [Diploschistes diacapsis]|nr:MAG: hypothetical protein LQ340_003202 [Diploschistes diacapsis]
MHLTLALAPAILAFITASANQHLPVRPYPHSVMSKRFASPSPNLKSGFQKASSTIKTDANEAKNWAEQHAAPIATGVQQGAQWYNQHADAVKKAGGDATQFAKDHEKQLGKVVGWAEQHKGATEKVGKAAGDAAGLLARRDAEAEAETGRVLVRREVARAILAREAEANFKSFVQGAEKKAESGAKWIEQHKRPLESAAETAAGLAPLLMARGILAREAEAEAEAKAYANEGDLALGWLYARMAEADPEADTWAGEW